MEREGFLNGGKSGGEMRTRVRRTAAERQHEKRYKEVRREFARGNATRLLSRYLRFCEDGAEGEEGGTGVRPKAEKGKRERRRLPNPAGFCRFLGLSREAFSELEREFPTEAGRVRAIFEDEALNSELSATALGFYLRRLLGEEDTPAHGTGEVVVAFEHDIMLDGG